MSPALSYRDAFITLADTPQGELVPFYRDLLGCEPNPYQPDRYAEFHPAIGPKLFRRLQLSRWGELPERGRGGNAVYHPLLRLWRGLW